MVPSLQRTLLAWLLVPLLLIVPAGAALQYMLALQPAYEAFDHALADTVIAVTNFVQDDGGHIRFAMTQEAERSIRTDQFDSIYYAVIGPGERLLAGDAPLLQPRFTLEPGAWRFFDDEVHGKAVRIGARGVACGTAVCQVRVAETRIKRDRLRSGTLLAAVLSMIAVALASMVAVVLATRNALRPLRTLSREVGTRSLDDLSALDAAGAPREVHGLVDAINRLFGRLRRAAQAQQAFLADAAHQLRTPLAALRTDTELALLEPHPAEMRSTLERLHGSASRAARLSSQLLALARSDGSAQASGEPEPLDLKDVAESLIGEWLPRAIDAEIDLGFDLHSAPLRGRSSLLRELLANLIHNALEYAGRGARLTVRTRCDGSTRILEVDDDGPGIAAADRERVFERFRRGTGAPGSGSGLGLAIVRDIATAHGAVVELLVPESGGTRVRVTFAAAA